MNYDKLKKLKNELCVQSFLKAKGMILDYLKNRGFILTQRLKVLQILAIKGFMLIQSYRKRRIKKILLPKRISWFI
jgi:hypothetical protein